MESSTDDSAQRIFCASATGSCLPAEPARVIPDKRPKRGNISLAKMEMGEQKQRDVRLIVESGNH